MVTLTWFGGVPLLFDKARQQTYGKLTLTLFGKIKLRNIWVSHFDSLDFVEVGNNELIRILYGV